MQADSEWLLKPRKWAIDEIRSSLKMQVHYDNVAA
jgi:hypothetical protein